MFPTPKYKPGDVLKLIPRMPSLKYRVVVVCGYPSKDQYSTLPIEEYIVAKTWKDEPDKSPKRRRHDMKYIDDTAVFLGTELESIRILYD